MKKIVILLQLLLITSVAKAEFLLEPYLGINATVAEYNTALGSTGEGVAGTIIGFRAGITYTMFFAAFDYHVGSSMDYETTDGSGNAVTLSGDLSRSGITVGADLPIIPFRLWLGYYTGALKTSNGIYEAEFKDGTGTKFGIGFTAIPFIDINIETFAGTYDDITITNLFAATSNSADETGVTISLSSSFTF